MRETVTVQNVSPDFRAAYRPSLVLAGTAVLALCCAFVFGSSQDEEEIRFALLSTWLRVQSFRSFDSAFWTSLLGLGVPQPFVPSYSLHPLAPLIVWMRPVAWVRLLLVTHTVVGAIGMWRLGSMLEFPPIVRTASVVTFLLAAPVQNYVLVDFWPSHYVVWTLVPWLVLMTWRVIDPATLKENTPRWAAGLGLLAGLVAANGNPAYLVVYVPVAAIMGVMAWTIANRRVAWIAAAVAIAGAIAAPIVTLLITERRYFDPELKLSNIQDPLPLVSAWHALVYPFAAEPTTRTLFFGAPYAALALFGCVWFVRQRLDLVLGFLVSAVLLFTTWVPMPWVSQRYQFRDPVTLFGVLLAGLTLSRMMAHRKWRSVAVVVAVSQVAAVAAGSVPVLARNLNEEGRAALSLRGATGDTPLMDRLIDHMPSRGRLLYSPRVSHDVAERAFVIDGLGVNSPVYRGIPLVNGWLKGASADAVWPNDRLFYGRVHTSQLLLESDDALDVLAIRYVLAYYDEPVAAGLRPLTTVNTIRGATLVLYENANAWLPAFLLDPVADGDVPVRRGCENDRVLCRDFGAVVPHRDSTPIVVTRDENGIRITRMRAAAPTLLVVSEMFRPQWVATAEDRQLPIQPMFGGLLGVSLPAGLHEVRLVYRPTEHHVAIGVCLVSIITATLLILRRPSSV